MRRVPRRFWYAFIPMTFLVVLLIWIQTAASGRQTPQATDSLSALPTATDKFVIELPTCLPQATSSTPTPSDELVIYSWWTSGNGARRLEALTELFMEDHPGTRITNCAMDCQGSMDEILPQIDSFQYPIPELIDKWQAGGYLESVSFLFTENHWLDQYPSGVLDYVSHDGEIWGVPVSVHRVNVLWFNKSIFTQYDLDPPRTWDEFFAAADDLKAAGVVPLTLDDSEWGTTLVFETVLQGSLGAEEYRGLWDGRTDWNGSEVRSALETLARILSYVDEDHSYSDWQEATDRVIKGHVAMTIMGDWVMEVEPTPGDVLGHVPVPGTVGIFDMEISAFVLPKNAKHRDLAVDWLTLCGSQEGQAAFIDGVPGGGIPALLNSDPYRYDAYTQWAMGSWASDQIVPSHINTVNLDWRDAIYRAMDRFSTDRDVETAVNELAQAAHDFLHVPTP